jgi:hypothetical protein
MQGGEEIPEQDEALKIWLAARDAAVEFAGKLAALGVHKQFSNRILEPFTHITVVASATEWDNFFALRCHKDAQPEFQALAKAMYKVRETSKPEQLVENEWHLPFITQSEKNQFGYSTITHAVLVKCSVARCARVSYLNHDGSNPDIQKDLELHDKLVRNFPMHASPAEHQAWAVSDPNERSGNFRGFRQYRKSLVGENVEQFDGSSLTEPKE